MSIFVCNVVSADARVDASLSIFVCNVVSADARLAISPASTESFVASTELTRDTTSANVSASVVEADIIASIRDFSVLIADDSDESAAWYAVVIAVSRVSVYALASASA